MSGKRKVLSQEVKAGILEAIMKGVKGRISLPSLEFAFSQYVVSSEEWEKVHLLPVESKRTSCDLVPRGTSCTCEVAWVRLTAAAIC